MARTLQVADLQGSAGGFVGVVMVLWFTFVTLFILLTIIPICADGLSKESAAAAHAESYATVGPASCGAACGV
ncbi:hypothetical protein LIER_09535 [Lithospermum erythrorhizon]|uniref:Uncharacterized protein n=1 Tax=Lithospermum erythrorhizon TaxID=34254 RepID=A0AAV3PG63_LITER